LSKEKVVSQIFTSWNQMSSWLSPTRETGDLIEDVVVNQIGAWLRQIHGLRNAA
jgi:hypothetical protein